MHLRKSMYFCNYVRYLIVAMVAIPIMFMAASSVQAHEYSIAHQHIDGDPLDIVVYDTGQMELWFQGVYQYYGHVAWGSVLVFTDGELVKKYSDEYHAYAGALVFTPVSNAVHPENPWEINTVMNTGGPTNGITVTQKVEYTNTFSYYKMTWTLTNTSDATFTNCKFFHGGDSYFAGDDRAQSYWDENLGMVYLRNPGVSGLMGFYGGAGSRADRYFGGQYSTGNSQAVAGELSNTVDPTFLDAGYHLQWNRESLAPGETWTITAYEKWTEAGNVQVMAPADQTVTKGTAIDLAFTVQNFQATTVTFNLVAESELGWPVSLPNGNTIEIASGQSAQVIVRVTPPAGTDTADDTITLTATAANDPSVFNSDSVKVTGTPGEVVTPEEPEAEDVGDDGHHNDWCFISTAEHSSNSGMLILAAAIIGLGCIIRFRTAGARIDK